MSDEPPNERRSSRRDVPSEATERQRTGPPGLDEVFLDDDEVELGEEDTRSVAAIDALGLRSGNEADDEASPLGSSPSGARLSAPPGAIQLRPRVSAPPMAVSQVRAPVSAPPPFLSRVSAVDLSDQVALDQEGDASADWRAPADTLAEQGEPESDPIAFSEASSPASAPFADLQSDPYPAALADAEPMSEPGPDEIADADLHSAPEQDRVPAAQPARALRASAPPWERSRSTADPSLRALFAASHSRPQSLPPPPPGGTPRPPTPLPAATTPPPLPYAQPSVDRYQVPKTLVSGPPAAPILPSPLLPEVVPAKPRRGAWAVFLALLFVCGLGFGFWFLETTQPGSLVLSVSAKRGAPVTGLRLFLDGQLACRASPCEVSQLAAGTHFVRVEADGFPPTADQAVVVEPRGQTTHQIVLERPAGDAGVSIVTPVAGFSVTLDGSERGATPIDLTGLDPGEHTLVLEKDGFRRYDEVLTLEQGKTAEMRPMPLLLEGTLKVRALRGSEDAEVHLDGKLVALPLERKLPANAPHILQAKKPESAPFVRRIEFSPESPVVEIELNLAAPSQSSDDDPESERREVSRVASGSGKATLNFNSIPSSSVVLDGKPLGQTPVMGVRVSPGAHNVVFVHPELGRKPVQVDVDEGAKRTVSVRF